MATFGRIAAIGGGLGLLAVPAAAQAEPCAPLAIEADARARARAPKLLDRLRSTFAGRTDIDTCAKIRVARSTHFDVEVALPDGRIARRSVSRVEDIAPVLEALLVVPATATPDTETATATATNEARPAPEERASDEAPSFAGSPALPEAADRATTPIERGRAVGFEISALTGVRLGDGSSGSVGAMGVGAQSFVDVADWLVGLGGRLDGYTATSSPISTIELAVLLGHRFRWTSVTIDLVGGPAALVGSSPNDRPPTLGENGRPLLIREDRPVLPRLLGGARLNLRARSTFRPFVGIDGQVGTSWRSDTGTVSLPLAMIGLSLGATVGTR